eukprot:jgi/Ulvmu1/8943/UM005_0034.1
MIKPYLNPAWPVCRVQRGTTGEIGSMEQVVYPNRHSHVAFSTTEECDRKHIKTALDEALIAFQQHEVPIGAVIVKDSHEICRAHNQVEHTKDPTAHAEMRCIQQASKKLGAWRLAGCTLYVTVEPCPMCAGALLQARLDRVVYGAPNPLLGADGSWMQILPRLTSSQDNDSMLLLEPVSQSLQQRHPFHVSMRVCCSG